MVRLMNPNENKDLWQRRTLKIPLISNVVNPWIATSQDSGQVPHLEMHKRLHNLFTSFWMWLQLRGQRWCRSHQLFACAICSFHVRVSVSLLSSWNGDTEPWRRPRQVIPLSCGFLTHFNILTSEKKTNCRGHGYSELTAKNLKSERWLQSAEVSMCASSKALPTPWPSA